MPVAAAAFFATRFSFDPVFRSALFADFLTFFDKDPDFLRRFMTYSASERLEIIELVEQSTLSVARTLASISGVLNLESSALVRRTGNHAMKSFTRKSDSSQPAAETAVYLFEDWHPNWSARSGARIHPGDGRRRDRARDTAGSPRSLAGNCPGRQHLQTGCGRHRQWALPCCLDHVLCPFRQAILRCSIEYLVMDHKRLPWRRREFAPLNAIQRHRTSARASRPEASTGNALRMSASWI